MAADPMDGNGGRIERLVEVLARSTEALVGAGDESRLLQDICQIGAELGDYPLVWIGTAHAEGNGRIRLLASAGPAVGYLDRIRDNLEGENALRGPPAQAVYDGRYTVVDDTAMDPAFAAWADIARDFGLRSAMALPIDDGGGRLGVLCFYAGQTGAFDALSQRILSGLARNLALGVTSLRVKTSHDQTARELAESEERYRSLIEMAPDAILVHSAGTVLFANPASARVFGAEGRSTTLAGRPLLDLVHGDHRTEVAASLDALPAGARFGQYRLIGLDGRVFDAEVNSCAITFRGTPSRLLTIRDITERTQVQEQMLQNAKLATLGEMAAGLVHELSQPLNIMRLAAEGALMLIERGKASPEWQVQQFQLVAEQSERAAEIIDDIRIFSRRDTTPLQVFEAVDAVATAVDVLQRQVKPDGIVLELERPGHPSPVRGRRVQLEQVVMNLLNNAHHALRDVRPHMPRDWSGHIRVATVQEGERLRIIITDNGPGIPAAIRERIFEPFFTTKDTGRGTGLGLSVSYSLIASMGGKLQTLDSGSGAIFQIELPLVSDAPAESLPNAPSAPAHGAFSGSHILVVEDESAAADALALYLRALGCRVSIAADGEKAWAVFRHDPADVVITDLRMPAGDGEELVEKLRDFDPLLPIVIMTGHLGATERLTETLQDDRCAVLKKPLALGGLSELIARFLRPPEQ